MAAPTPPTGKLLALAYLRYESWLRERFAAAGHDEIRPKHGSVLGNLDPKGSRPSELARRAGMGKPAMGELIDDLVRAGYLERVPDPTDGRARLVVPTERGLDAIRVGRRVAAEVEREVQLAVGRDNYAELRASLTRLAGDREAGT